MASSEPAWRFQFSVRGLLLLTFVLAVVLAGLRALAVLVGTEIVVTIFVIALVFLGTFLVSMLLAVGLATATALVLWLVCQIGGKLRPSGWRKQTKRDDRPEAD